MRLPFFLNVIGSPFKALKLKFYFGKIAKGTPYFLPRRWVKFTEEDALNTAKEVVSNKYSANYGRDPLELVDSFKSYSKSVPRIIGFDINDLGWKTKWTRKDFRFEYSPVWSFVFFKYQLAVTFVAPHLDHYWECFLYYYYETDKSKSKKERIKECIKENPCVWRSFTHGEEEIIDYYKLILKDKYIN